MDKTGDTIDWLGNVDPKRYTFAGIALQDFSIEQLQKIAAWLIAEHDRGVQRRRHEADMLRELCLAKYDDNGKSI